MKRHLIAAYILAMSAFTLTGCSGSTGSSQASTESTAADTEADAADATATEADVADTEAAEADAAAAESVEPTGKTISPVPSSVNLENLVENMDDCMVAVSIDEGGVYKNDAGTIMMDVTLYDYDQYDMVDISQMQVGDTITICGEDVLITSLEDTNGFLVINGGIEQGGYELVGEDTVYRATSWDDLKLYNKVGQGSFPVSSDFAMEDSSDLEAGTVTYTIDDILDGKVDYWFVPNNTTVRIAGGEIVSLTRVYNP